ncbi:hypothetical protein [uncultured Parabacteroides sp.]|uniref:tetratricopeptide repeat protein n=1 Tax=uncultured Parabacteroides sp. TaxID=512312 RepID=UPI0025D0F8FC|nr:hypothetical protein [uncultured Parabacteroides sp.]
MDKYFSDKVEEGIRLVWCTFQPEEMQKGLQLLEEAANEGDADAMCFLARAYMGKEYVWGDGGLPFDRALAYSWVNKSVMKGSAAGVLSALRLRQLTSSICKEMPCSLKAARDIILERAEAGHAFCQYMIGDVYYWGDLIVINHINVKKKYPTNRDYDAFADPIAVGWYERALKNGLTLPARNLQVIFEDGVSPLGKNDEKLFYYTKLAAELGDPEMMNNYGVMLSDADREEEGLLWCKKSADAGESVGCYNIGDQYEYGWTVEEDQVKAFEYYMKAAQKENPSAYYKIGYYYYYGKVVKQDKAQAVYWLKKGEEEDEYWPCPLLGVCYQNGWGGLEVDYDYAYDLLCLADSYSDEFDDETLGVLWNGLGNAFYYGWGINTNYVIALQYYQEAVEVGNAEAKKNIKKFHIDSSGKWRLA